MFLEVVSRDREAALQEAEYIAKRTAGDYGIALRVVDASILTDQEERPG